MRPSEIDAVVAALEPTAPAKPAENPGEPLTESELAAVISALDPATPGEPVEVLPEPLSESELEAVISALDPATTAKPAEVLEPVRIWLKILSFARSSAGAAWIAVVASVFVILPIIYFSWYLPFKERADNAQLAERRWQEVQTSTNVADIWNFVQRFGATTYAPLARTRLENMASPVWPVIKKTIATDIIRMEACKASWNQRITNEDETRKIDRSSWGIETPVGVPYKMGDVSGLKFSYHSSAMTGDVCGWYFIPDGYSPLEKLAAKAQVEAILESMSAFQMAASRIVQIIPPDGGVYDDVGKQNLENDLDVINAIGFYNQSIDRKMEKIIGIADRSKLNSATVTNTDELLMYEKDHKASLSDLLRGNNTQDALDLRKRVSGDLSSFGAD
jgi:hypothetical protein